MILRCLIIDDKPLAVDILTDYVQKTSFLELAAATTNPIEGLDILREQSIDLVFLDIQMPELSGLQLMKIIGKQRLFILTTAYPDYALEGYEHDVVDYLLKPISFDRFYRSAEKALKLAQLTALSSSPATPVPDPLDYLFVKTEHRIQRILLSELLYAESLQNYVSLYTTSGRIMTLQTLNAIEEQLPRTSFCRVHRSYIVGLRHISSVEKSRIAIGDTIIPIGDKYRDSFFQAIKA
ncbi:LytR/AlgR family response regulator transcription factor [Paraflavitalea pollutisoli]|uniref:LytR/AlgR family response regulator transcription factor n=1 Tax=Paraflavitalea pollutisoli TaxID=3034143 RepID=UPI0023EB2A9D|nr:LytTR family DNA-binding domain-containing protein [Paraflavitalea sp. H1-2-19X]